MKQVGVDPETGQFDADVVETGTTKTQRDRITMIKNYIEELELKYEDGAPVEEVLDMAEEKYPRTKVIGDIDKLKEQGQAYEPNEGHLRLS